MNNKIKFEKNLILKRIIFFIMLIVTFYIIFGFSAQDGKESGTISNKVTTFIINIFVKMKMIEENLKLDYVAKFEPIIRKLAHFSIYTILGFSMMGFICTYNIKDNIKIIISSLIGLVYAISDEIHQSFTPGRGPRLFDVGIDFLGVLNGIFIMILLIKFVNYINNRTKNKSLAKNN